MFADTKTVGGGTVGMGARLCKDGDKTVALEVQSFLACIHFQCRIPRADAFRETESGGIVCGSHMALISCGQIFSREGSGSSLALESTWYSDIGPGIDSHMMAHNSL